MTGITTFVIVVPIVVSYFSKKYLGSAFSMPLFLIGYSTLMLPSLGLLYVFTH